MSPEVGRVFSINISDGGVPKLPVPEALVSSFGVFGDNQSNKKHHGGPDRAVCIFSLERIRALEAEGHPIGIGTTGENLTVAGLSWDLIRPGTILEVGDATLEVTAYTTPCRTIRESFTGHWFMRMSHKHYPGWSRVYARVVREGMIHTGDTVTATASRYPLIQL